MFWLSTGSWLSLLEKREEGEENDTDSDSSDEDGKQYIDKKQLDH